jgi:hypothetical protein
LRAATLFVAGLMGLFVQISPSMLHAATSDALSITITPRDNVPPAAVTDLSATPGGVGQMLLQWSAPDSNNNQVLPLSAAASYTVRIATFSIDSLSGDTTAWWTLAQDVTGEPPPSMPGTTDYLLLNGLSPGVTYYAGLISTDAEGLSSPIDVKSATPGQQAHALIFQPAIPSVPLNFTGIALSTRTIQWTWDITPGALFYTLNAFPSGSLINQTTDTLLIETPLNPNTALSRTLRAGNGTGLSNATASRTVYTLAAVPINLTITNVTFTSIALSWNSAGNANGTQYRLERSEDGVGYVPVITVSTTNYNNTGLSDLTTYYYRVVAFNGDGLITAPSLVVSTTTPEITDLIAPDVPMGLKGSLDPSGNAFTFNWEAVTQSADGTAITDLVGYNVYRRTTLFGTPVKITPNPIATRAYADVVNGQVLYYTVRAVDTSGNESPDSMSVDSSGDANVIFVGPDNLSTLTMPSSVNDVLRSAYNKYNVPLYVRLTEEPVASASSIIRHIKLTLHRSDTKAAVADVAFAKPQSIIAIAYNLIGGQVGYGSPLSVNAAPTPAAVTPSQLSIYWSNGVTWVKVGGTIDPASQTVKIKSSFLGNYQLRVAATATSLSLDKANVYPRVFTPNGDGYNDRVYFVLENPNSASVTGEIMDLGGRVVAHLMPQSGTGIGTTLIWDGKDTSGAVVPGGAYMYKIKGEGKTFTGTVGVAR